MVKKIKKPVDKKKLVKKQEKEKLKNYKPFVSICTPTFNRRPFIPYTIKCFEHQDYPRDRMEWIIIDDGTDPIEDIVKDVSGVKYFRYEEKMSLGKKRNLMHDKSSGEIIVYMDDDDYYPPTRVSHAVKMLTMNKKALCSGSSRINIWFKHIQQMYEFGPYGPNHATAGTFAFKRELLNITRYDDDAALAEEKAFLKNYTIPFVQLDPMHTILVFSHNHNTFDKKKLLVNANPKIVKPIDKTVDHFIKDPELKEFYTEKIDDLLKDYKEGEPENKPDVIKQTEEITQRRIQMQNEQIKVNVTNHDGKMKEINLNELNEHIHKIIKENTDLKNYLNGIKLKLNETFKENMNLKQTNINFEERIKQLENENNKLNIQLKQLNNINIENIEINIDEQD